MHVIGTLVFVLAVGQLGKGAHPGAEEKNAAHENAGGDHPLEWLADTLSDSAHLLDTRKWGRDPELCADFFLNGATGRCPDSDTCCGALNFTSISTFRVDIYCCHDNEKCCQGICCNDHAVCCRRKPTPDREGYGQCCYKERGCCVDIHGNAVCCTTMLGRYWWVIAVSLTIYLVTKVTMMVRRYRAMPDIGEERLEEDRALKVRVRRMTYCC